MDRLSFFPLGLIGWPVGHSLSPVILGTALSECELKGAYELLPICPLPEGNNGLIEIFQRMRQGEIHGLNVTIPHKQNVIPYLDSLTPSAQEIGAVNTVYFEDGKLVGDNTDADGFQNDLQREYTPCQSDGLALVLGAGGSSRAVVHALFRDGWRVMVAARRLGQAQTLVNDLSAGQRFEISAIGLDPASLKGLCPGLVVNTTPVGMAPKVGASPWPVGVGLPEGCLIYDLVYRPGETLFMKQGREQGIKAVNGIGMLVEQAALSFEKWTGNPAPREAMREAVTVRLQEIQSFQEVGDGA